MKILKKILIGLAILIALVLITALFVKNDYTIEREIVINKPKHEVFDYIKLLKNQAYYSKWVMQDPNVKREEKGTDGTVGYITSWDSDHKEVGKGEQEIKGIVDGERLDLALHFIKPFEGRATAYMITETVTENQTKVKWGFNGSMPYPFNIMRIIMNIEKQLGGDLTLGLTNLKSVLEKE